MIGRRALFGGLVAGTAATAQGPTDNAGPLTRVPPARLGVLARGVNLTNWFRWPASQEPTFFRNWVSDGEMEALRGVGFTHVRLAVHDDVIRPRGTPDGPRLGLLQEQIVRLRGAGLAVIVGPHMRDPWRPETNAADRERLVSFWRTLAPRLAPFDPDAVFPEIVNEPVFSDRPADWDALQAEVAAAIRAALPRHTIIGVGGRWSSVEGLVAATPIADRNVIYAVHSYEPVLMATLASWAGDGIDRDALARLPWPIRGRADCAATLATPHARTRDMADWFCGGPKNRETLRQHFAPARAWARRHDVPVIVGEFGFTGAIPAQYRNAFFRDLIAVFADFGFGWTLWGYEDGMGLGRRRAPDGSVVMDPNGVLPALGLRPAPPVVR